MTQWVLCYRRGRTTKYGTEHVVGSTIVDEHPLLVLNRWNELYRREAERDKLPAVVVVLTWYEKLDDDILSEMLRRDIDPTAQDREISL